MGLFADSQKSSFFIFKINALESGVLTFEDIKKDHKQGLPMVFYYNSSFLSCIYIFVGSSMDPEPVSSTNVIFECITEVCGIHW